MNMRIYTRQGYLEALKTHHANELFELIHSSRRHLHPWLPWLQKIHSPHDTEVFIQRLTTERGPQFVIKTEERICGGMGFYFFDQQGGLATLGYWLGEEYTGQGLASDAIKSACYYGFNELGLERIEIRCALNNIPSRTLAENLGFYLDGEVHNAEWLTDRYVDHACYSMLKEEFNVVYFNDMSYVLQPDTEEQSAP